MDHKDKKMHVNTLLKGEGGAGVPQLTHRFSNHDSGTCCCTEVPAVVQFLGCNQVWGTAEFLDRTQGHFSFPSRADLFMMGNTLCDHIFIWHSKENQ